jgi:hypothetical protein
MSATSISLTQDWAQASMLQQPEFHVYTPTTLYTKGVVFR